MIYSILTIVFLSLAIVYFFLRMAINSQRITRIEQGNLIDIYVNDTLIESKQLN